MIAIFIAIGSISTMVMVAAMDAFADHIPVTYPGQ